MKMIIYIYLLLSCIMFAQTELNHNAVNSGNASSSEGNTRLISSVGQVITGINSNENIQGSYGFLSIYSKKIPVSVKFLNINEPKDHTVNILPNPVENDTKIEFFAFEQGTYNFKIINYLGVKIANFTYLAPVKGLYTFSISINEFPAGVFQIICNKGDHNYFGKIVKY